MLLPPPPPPPPPPLLLHKQDEVPGSRVAPLFCGGRNSSDSTHDYKCTSYRTPLSLRESTPNRCCWLFCCVPPLDLKINDVVF
jgi:hypothetical protein